MSQHVCVLESYSGSEACFLHLNSLYTQIPDKGPVWLTSTVTENELARSDLPLLRATSCAANTLARTNKKARKSGGKAGHNNHHVQDCCPCCAYVSSLTDDERNFFKRVRTFRRKWVLEQLRSENMNLRSQVDQLRSVNGQLNSRLSEVGGYPGALLNDYDLSPRLMGAGVGQMAMAGVQMSNDPQVFTHLNDSLMRPMQEQYQQHHQHHQHQHQLPHQTYQQQQHHQHEHQHTYQVPIFSNGGDFSTVVRPTTTKNAESADLVASAVVVPAAEIAGRKRESSKSNDTRKQQQQTSRRKRTRTLTSSGGSSPTSSSTTSSHEPTKKSTTKKSLDAKKKKTKKQQQQDSLYIKRQMKLVIDSRQQQEQMKPTTNNEQDVSAVNTKLYRHTYGIGSPQNSKSVSFDFLVPHAHGATQDDNNANKLDNNQFPDLIDQSTLLPSSYPSTTIPSSSTLQSPDAFRLGNVNGKTSRRMAALMLSQTQQSQSAQSGGEEKEDQDNTNKPTSMAANQSLLGVTAQHHNVVGQAQILLAKDKNQAEQKRQPQLDASISDANNNNKITTTTTITVGKNNNDNNNNNKSDGTSSPPVFGGDSKSGSNMNTIMESYAAAASAIQVLTSSRGAAAAATTTTTTAAADTIRNPVKTTVCCGL